MEEKNQRIIIKDPLYKQIFIEPEHKQFIDCKEFQRLRHIKQTSFDDFVYPNANHTRFSHSMGTYHLMKKVLSNNLTEMSENDKKNMLIAALLHDIGHGPFSHFWEKVFPQFDHEKATQDILRQKGLVEVADILAGKNPFYYFISSSIDVDKLDYMARDSYFAGVSYGVAEVDFIIEHMYIKDGKMIIKPSALSSVEDLITQRVNLFKTVYFHKFAVEYDFLFSKIFKRVKHLLDNNIEINVNRHIKSFFQGNNDLNNLQALNDAIIVAQVFEWAEHTDDILSDLCTMYVERKKFNAINVKYSDVDVEAIKRKVSDKYDCNYYFGHEKMPIKIIQTPIYVEFKRGLKKLSEVSELIQFYENQDWNVEFIIFPRDINYEFES